MRTCVMFCPVCGEGVAPHRVNNASVSLKCMACGATSSATCSVGLLEVSQESVEMVRPESKAPGKDRTSKVAADVEGDEKEEWVWLRFAVTKDQREVIQRCMRAMRTMMHRHGDETVNVRAWHGVTLEYLCADALAGVVGQYVEEGVQ